MTLALIILGYFYLSIPVIFLVSVCVCLPVAIVFLIVVKNPTGNYASQSAIDKLEITKYNPEKHQCDTCAICAYEYRKRDKIIVLKCDPRHLFHPECIKKWLKINANCPICRSALFA